jgi:hypothetical protein
MPVFCKATHLVLLQALCAFTALERAATIKMFLVVFFTFATSLFGKFYNTQ